MAVTVSLEMVMHGLTTIKQITIHRNQKSLRYIKARNQNPFLCFLTQNSTKEAFHSYLLNSICLFTIIKNARALYQPKMEIFSSFFSKENMS